MDLLAEVCAYIERHRLLDRGDAVVVGVSGGPDSVALLHLLHQLVEPWGLRLHVAHLHHGIRGLDADADAEYVGALAQRLALPWTLERVSLPDLAREQGLALEEAARRVRYAFLARTARRLGARRIAVGHNADDQAETVLMHLLRGAGLSGLRGMLPDTPLSAYRLLSGIDKGEEPDAPALHLIRPLLSTPRSAIEAYCEDEGLSPRFDRSNLDTTFFRNRLRHELLPQLEAVSPQVGDRLRNLAEVVRADYDLLEQIFDTAWRALLVREQEQLIAFELAGWRAQPLAVQRALVRRAAYRLRRTLRDVSFVHVEDAVAVGQTGETGAQATLPRRLLLEVGYDTLDVREAEAVALPAHRPWLEPGRELPVTLPGRTALSDGWALDAVALERWQPGLIASNPNPHVAWLDAAAVGPEPLLRTRREGDRFRPHGMGGVEVRLSDFLINVKVPRRWRDYLPLLVAGDEILWVVGERLSERACVRPTTERVFRLEVSHAG